MSQNHKSLTGTRAWRRVRLRVFERDGYRCVCCGKAGRLECDHIIPLPQVGGRPARFVQPAVACAELPYREDARGELRGAGPCRVAGITTAHGIKKRRPMVSAGACRVKRQFQPRESKEAALSNLAGNVVREQAYSSTTIYRSETASGACAVIAQF